MSCTMPAILYLFILLLTEIQSTQGNAAGLRGQNLLCDPSAEQVDSTCWKVEGDGPLLRVPGNRYAQGAVEGDLMLTAAVGHPVSQDVNVKEYPAGEVFLLTAFLSSVNLELEKGCLLMKFLNSNGTVVQSSRSPLWPPEFMEANAERWHRYTAYLTKPENAETLRLTLLTLASSETPEMFWDAFHLAANLLINPSAEYMTPTAVTPAIDGWTAFSDDSPPPVWWNQTRGHWPLKAQSGLYYFTPPLLAITAYLYQDVDVSSYPTGKLFLMELYLGAIVNDDGFTMEPPPSDAAAIMIQWYASTDEPLEWETVPDQTFNVTQWSVRRFLRPKPDTAQFCRIMLVSRRQQGINDDERSRVFFDSIFFGPADHHAKFSTLSLALGDVHITESGMRTINVTNDGAFTTLTVLDVSLTQSEGSALQLTGLFPVDIPPLGTQSYSLYIRHDQPATMAGTLTFTLLDPVTPTVVIPISCEVTVQQARLNVHSKDFGRVHVLTGPYEFQIRMDSIGAQPLQYLGLDFNFNGTGIELVSFTEPQALAQYDAAVFNVRFTPSDGPPGLNEGYIVIRTNDPSHAEVIIPIRGIVDDYSVALSLTSLDFQQHHISLGTVDLPLEVTNVGHSGRLKITSIRVGGDQFSLDTTRPRTLDPGESAVWLVTFTPRRVDGSACGDAFGDVILTTNDPARVYIDIPVYGLGSDQWIFPSPSSLTLVPWHKHSDISPFTEDITLYARGTQGKLRLSAVQLISDDGRPVSFNITAGLQYLPFSVVVGGSFGLTIAFNPKLDGDGPIGWRNATLVVYSDDPAMPQLAIQLAAQAQDYRVELQYQRYDFGEWHLTKVPATIPFTIRNIGTLGNLIYYATQFDSAWTAYSLFGRTPTFAEIPPGGAFNLSVSFNPRGLVGFRDAWLRIQTNDPDTPLASCYLTATGVDPTLQLLTSSVIFPIPVHIDGPPISPISVSYGNVGRLGGLVLDVELVGDYANQFQIAGFDESPLPPGQRRSFFIYFDPNITGINGALRAQLYLRPSYGFEVSIPVEGHAVNPRIALSTTTINFGQWDIMAGARDFGNGNRQFDLRIRNVGTTVLQILNYSVNINPGGSYSVPPLDETQTMIGVGDTWSLPVMWDPNNPNGKQRGILQVTSTDMFSPVVNVTLIGQAVEQLGLNAPFIGNVSFNPPFAGHASTVKLFLYTSDTGLPMDGSLRAIFPPDFDVSHVTARIDSTFFGHDRTVVNGTDTVTIQVAGSGLQNIEKGAHMLVQVYDVVLPSMAACEQSISSWRWTVLTYDANGGLLEFAIDASLPGEACVAPKEYTLWTTPILLDPPQGLEAGYHVELTVIIPNADSMVTLGVPLLDTREGADQIKIIAAFQDGPPQYCSESARPEGAIVPFSDDLGDTDSTEQVNATFRTAFFSGSWRICYRQSFGAFGWEQVGDVLHVADKPLAEEFVVPEGLDLPISMQNDWWARVEPPRAAENGTIVIGEVQPLRVIVGEKVQYSFVGAFFNGGLQLRAKVASQIGGCSGAAPGTPFLGVPIEGNVAQFTVEEPSLYTICVQDRAPYWVPLDFLWVRTVADADPLSTTHLLFSGFQTCAGYTTHFQDRCGCFLGDGEKSSMTLDEDQAVHYILGAIDEDQTVNQGCCTGLSDRIMVEGVAPKWGYCKMP